MAVTVKKSKKEALPQEGVTEVAPVGQESIDSEKTGTHVIKKHVMPMVKVPKQYANVGVVASRTINLGDWNSVKVGVSLHYPCAADAESVEQTYAFVKNWVDSKMETLTDIEGSHAGQD